MLFVVVVVVCQIIDMRIHFIFAVCFTPPFFPLNLVPPSVYDEGPRMRASFLLRFSFLGSVMSVCVIVFWGDVGRPLTHTHTRHRLSILCGGILFQSIRCTIPGTLERACRSLFFSVLSKEQFTAAPLFNKRSSTTTNAIPLVLCDCLSICIYFT